MRRLPKVALNVAASVAVLLTPGRGFEIMDVREKILLERRRGAIEREREKLRQAPQPQVVHDELGDEEVAQDVGLVPRPDERVNLTELKEKKDRMRSLMLEQHRRKVASKEAFVEWQAGQREKGAAHRLSRQSRKAEAHKRLHCESQRCRLVPTAFSTPSWNTNNDMTESVLRALSTQSPRVPPPVSKASDYINPSQKETKAGSLFLTVSKR